MSIEDLKGDNYQAQSRNKLITEAFYLTNDIEKYGSGYRRVREQIAKYPTMYFNFEENSGEFLVKIGYKKQRTISNDPVNNRISLILEFITQDKYITRHKLAIKCSVSIETIKRDVRKLKEQKIIERVGSDKTGYWKIIK